jgi:hypothetical protein
MVVGSKFREWRAVENEERRGPSSLGRTRRYVANAQRNFLIAYVGTVVLGIVVVIVCSALH